MNMTKLSLNVIALLLACSNPNGAETKIQTVDMLLAKICERAATCPGSSATPAELDACPFEIQAQLNQSDLDELQRFTTYGKDRQDAILDCIATAICARFGGNVLFLSDSDVMEPYRECAATA